MKKFALIGGGVLVALLALGAILDALGVETGDDEAAEQVIDEAAEPEPEPDAEPEPEPEPERPEISEAHIEIVTSFAQDEDAVQDAHVSVEDDEVAIALIVGAATSEDEAQRLLDNAARLLASQVAAEHDELDGPVEDDLGDLWDHYTLLVMAGPNQDDLIARGAKVPTSPHITW